MLEYDAEYRVDGLIFGDRIYRETTKNRPIGQGRG
jgi:hypothetical protein